MLQIHNTGLAPEDSAEDQKAAEQFYRQLTSLISFQDYGLAKLAFGYQVMFEVPEGETLETSRILKDLKKMFKPRRISHEQQNNKSIFFMHNTQPNYGSKQALYLFLMFISMLGMVFCFTKLNPYWIYVP